MADEHDVSLRKKYDMSSLSLQQKLKATVMNFFLCADILRYIILGNKVMTFSNRVFVFST